jgi:hypothetical protein
VILTINSGSNGIQAFLWCITNTGGSHTVTLEYRATNAAGTVSAWTTLTNVVASGDARASGSLPPWADSTASLTTKLELAVKDASAGNHSTYSLTYTASY